MAKSMSNAKIRKNIQDNLAKDIYNKNKMQNMVRTDKYDQKIFNQGIEWYNSGLEIKDAPEDIRNNTNFVRGFEKGKRLNEANIAIYEAGRNFFFGGFSLEQASEKMRVNPYFIKGYQDAQNLGKDLESLANGHSRY